MARLAELLERDLTEAEVVTVQRGGLQVGCVLDESRPTFGRDDFLLTDVTAADSRAGWITLAEPVAVGRTVQFHLCDADTAEDDLRAHLGGRDAQAALVFTSDRRGMRLYAEPHHDAGLVHEYLSHPAAAGIFCTTSFGPIAGHNVVHNAAAAIAMLRERRVGSQ